MESAIVRRHWEHFNVSRLFHDESNHAQSQQALKEYSYGGLCAVSFLGHRCLG